MREFATGLLVFFCLSATGMGEIQYGDPAGELTLQGLGDYQHTLNNYGERPATAIVFLSARCPVVEANYERIREIHQKYRRKDVLYVGVVSDPDQSVDEIREFMQKRGIIFPVYRDPEGKIRDRFGATVTPELFLLDREGKLTYHGGLDRDQSFQSLELATLSILLDAPAEVEDVPPHGTSIKAKLPPLPRTSPWEKMVFSSQMVFDKAPGASAFHCSTLTEATNGDLLCLWYGGTYESADDETLFLSRLKPGEVKWTPPKRIISDPQQPPGNAVLFLDGERRLWMVWARLEASRPIRRGSGWGQCRLMYRISNDHGETWSEDHPMLQEGVWGVPRNNPLVLKSGRILLPVEAVIGEKEGSVFLGTSDNGKSWEMSPLVLGGSQPALAQRADGSVLALMRQFPKITQVESMDEGRTWSAAVPTTVNNPDSGISMTRLKNGHLLLVYNDSPEDRSPLNIVRSIDDGKTWEKPLDLETNPGEYSYPCIVQTADGMIHISYTFRRYGIKHVRMNESWLTQFEQPN
ncbi:MAG: exo-alpha-sialidase [Planctomycetaceae bacterium]|nr:exo-alpha-sialidase [Planctomycetaceae bacterium]